MSPHTLESAILNSTPDVGFPDVLPFELGSWKLAGDSTVLTNASAPARVVVLGTEMLQWAANAANTVRASMQFTMPETYAFSTGNPGRNAATIDTTAVLDDQLALTVAIRRQRNQLDATAWAARLTVNWFTPGTHTAMQTLSTYPTVTVPTIGQDNTGSLADFARLNFDIGGRLRAEGKRILPGDTVRLFLGPDAALANNVLQITETTLRFRRHASIRDLTVRGILN